MMHLPYTGTHLEPNLDLCLRQLQTRRELGSLGNRQILLLLKLLLEREQLLCGERRARLAIVLVLAKQTLGEADR